MNSSVDHQSAAPRVSVVVRNFNRIDSIGRAIDSVLAQTWQDFEIVVVDDASTDQSVAYLHQRYRDEPRLKVLELLRNRGAAAAANTGYLAARGEYVAYLDSDDAWLPDFLSAHVRALDENPRAVMTYCGLFQVWSHYGFERMLRARRSLNQRCDMLHGGFIYSQSMTVLRRSALVEFGGFNVRYKVSHDFDLWLRFALAIEQPFVLVDRPLLRYHMSHDALTTDYQTWTSEYRAVLEEGFRHAAAAPWREQKENALLRVEAMVLARREVERWLRQNNELTTTVIVRTRDRLATLRRALSSIEAQTYDNYEVVVIDDASSDATPDWLATLEMPDLKVVSFDSSRGRAAALNYGLLVAEGELVTFLDDDDEWLPDYLERQVRAHAFVSNPPVFTFTDYFLCLEGVEEPLRRRHPRPDTTTDLLEFQLFDPRPHSLSMFAARRDVLQSVSGADEALAVGEDLDLYLRLLAAYCDPAGAVPSVRSPVHVREPLVKWHRGAAQEGREQMLSRYLEQAPALFEGFFASATGAHYRFLRDAVVRRFRQRIDHAWREHFPA